MSKAGVLLLMGAAVAGLIFFSKGKVSLGTATGYDPGILSAYYDISDVAYSKTAIDNDWNNTPPAAALENAAYLAQFVLDKVTSWLGNYLSFNSWYRTPQVNAAVGGTYDSDHLDASAADVEYYVDGSQNNALIVRAVLAQNLPFDQLIIYDDMDNPSRIHISYNKDRSPEDQANEILFKQGNNYSDVNYNDAQNKYLG